MSLSYLPGLTPAAQARAAPLAGKRARQSWLALALAFLVGGLAVADYATENFHLVVPGQVYRSAQLSLSTLEERIARHQLGSIINLRGPQPQDQWYHEEGAAALRHGIPRYDIPLRSAIPPTTQELRQLVQLLEEAPKPVLIHCHSGIDRSGMVAAISVLLLDDAGSPERARAQFTIWYGQFPWRKSTALHHALVNTYEDWLKEEGLEHSRASFRRWACQVYDGKLAMAASTNEGE